VVKKDHWGAEKPDLRRAAGVGLDPKQVENGRTAGVGNLTRGDARRILQDCSAKVDFIPALMF
jgi:hypothetical protein